MQALVHELLLPMNSARALALVTNGNSIVALALVTGAETKFALARFF